MNMHTKYIIFKLGILLFGLVIGYYVGYDIGFERAMKRSSLPDSENGKACTLEAKICPDGSSVGRSAPDCQFAPCPGE